MNWWQHLTDLGGLNVAGTIAAAIALWLGAAHCSRLALYWCALFGAAMGLVIASKLAFLGWGIGLQSLDFAGISGHAARAAAVLPVACFLLLRGQSERAGNIAAALGMMTGAATAASRVVLGFHSASEAALGWLLGVGVAMLFIARARAAREFRPSPLLVAATLVVVALLPRVEPGYSRQWMTAAALNLSGHDRAYQRWSWKLARAPYAPPCAPEKVRFTYMCT